MGGYLAYHRPVRDGYEEPVTAQNIRPLREHITVPKWEMKWNEYSVPKQNDKS